MIKFEKNVNCTMTKEMFLKIEKICKDREIPLSLFIREALKFKLKEEGFKNV
jgi:hypothetical protein